LQQYGAAIRAQGTLAQVWACASCCGLAAVGVCADGCVCMSQQDQVRDPRRGQRGPAALGWGGIEIATSTLLKSAVVVCSSLQVQ